MAPYCIPLAADYGSLADTLQTQRAQHAEVRPWWSHTGQISGNGARYSFGYCVEIATVCLTVENELYTWGFGTTGPTGHKTVDDEDIFVPTKLDLKKHLGQNTLGFQISGAGSIRSLSPNGTNKSCSHYFYHLSYTT
jgi:hypothetical protein